jgi:hypothetical protein
LSYGDITAPDESFDGNPRVFDEREVRLRDFLRPTSTFIYIYDFGDNWVHSIEIEKHLFIAPKPKQANCIEGARARPPEDVGGTSGYENFLAVIADPEDPEYADTKRWCGGHFDPEWFDFAVIDKDVRSALKPGAKRRLTQPRLKCAKIASINVITE